MIHPDVMRQVAQEMRCDRLRQAAAEPAIGRRVRFGRRRTRAARAPDAVVAYTWPVTC